MITHVRAESRNLSKRYLRHKLQHILCYTHLSLVVHPTLDGDDAPLGVDGEHAVLVASHDGVGDLRVDARVPGGQFN